MRIIFHKNFEKQYKKLPRKIKLKVQERVARFSQNFYDPALNNHSLRGKYADCRSINVTGDFRIIYKFLDRDTFLFVEIGTHPKLYNK